MPEKTKPAAATPAEIVDAWFVAHFHNAPIPLPTETYNHLFAAKDDLKRRLTSEEK